MYHSVNNDGVVERGSCWRRHKFELIKTSVEVIVLVITVVVLVVEKTSELSDIRTQLSNVQSQLASELSSVQSQLSDAETRLIAVSQEMLVLQTDLASVQAAITEILDFAQRLSTLNGTLNSMGEQVLATNVATNQTAIRVAALADASVAYEGKLDRALNKTLCTFQQQRALFQEDVAGLVVRMNSIVNESIADIQASIISLRNLTATFAERSDFDALNVTVQALAVPRGFAMAGTTAGQYGPGMPVGLEPDNLGGGFFVMESGSPNITFTQSYGTAYCAVSVRGFAKLEDGGGGWSLTFQDACTGAVIGRSSLVCNNVGGVGQQSCVWSNQPIASAFIDVSLHPKVQIVRTNPSYPGEMPLGQDGYNVVWCIQL